MAQGETALYWAQADNQVLPATREDSIGELKNIANYHRSLPHFAFLCTCESADPRAEAALGGLAQRLALFCHFRQEIIWKAYSIRLIPKILISAILLENKRSKASSIYS